MLLESGLKLDPDRDAACETVCDAVSTGLVPTATATPIVTPPKAAAQASNTVRGPRELRISRTPDGPSYR